ncbi:MAG: DedA family protein [Rhodospirillaceae bacterium]
MSGWESQIHSLIATYGYWVIGGIVALESMGIPLPGETTLVAAAIYAGSTARLDISLIISFAAAGAVVGDNAGFWLGRRIGLPLLIRYGHYILLTPARVKLGQYLFLCHGGKVVFFGRFVALLRVLAAFLAGANCMAFPKFFLFNAIGGVIWSIVFGVGGYLLGEQIHVLMGPAGAVGFVSFVILVTWLTLFVRRHEARLQAEAEQALPGLP